MSPSISTTVKNLWKKMTNKEYRDSYVAGHISNTVASQILMLREARGWTQKDLAEKTGMGQSRISALEDPNYENIQVGTLKRLASAFDVGLTLRFVPFSEVVTLTAGLSTEKLLVPDFANDRITASSSQTLGAIFTICVSTVNMPSLPMSTENLSISSFGVANSFGMNTVLGGGQTNSRTLQVGSNVSAVVTHAMTQPRMSSFAQNSVRLVANV